MQDADDVSAGRHPTALPASGANRWNLWPILWRELRSESRRRTNTALRWIGVTGLVLLLYLLLRDGTSLSASLNIRLFTNAHAFLLLAIWVLAPVLTSDCIAGEQRAGTLPLLFSTPLTALAIVLGKSCVHMGRVLTLWLSAVPVLLVPVVFGGVTSLDVISAVAIELSFALLALGAGVAVSPWIKHPMGALLAAEMVAAWVMYFFATSVAALYQWQVGPLLSSPATGPLSETWPDALRLFTGMFEGGGWSSHIDSGGPAGQYSWLLLLAEMLALAAVGCVLLIGMASSRTRSIWQEAPPSAQQERRRRTWLVPRYWLGRFATERRRRLDRNPLGWLQQHSTWARTSTLAWCGLILLANSLLLLSRHPWERFNETQVWLGILFSVQMTFTAVTTFRQERDSGALELLLVAPMSPREIVFRQLCGFWRRFLPSTLILVLLIEALEALDVASRSGMNVSVFVLMNYFTAPLIGVYASARFQSFTAGFLVTSIFSLLLPLAAAALGPGLPVGLIDLDAWGFFLAPTLAANQESVGFTVKAIQALGGIGASIALVQMLRGRTFETFALPRHPHRG